MTKFKVDKIMIGSRASEKVGNYIYKDTDKNGAMVFYDDDLEEHYTLRDIIEANADITFDGSAVLETADWIETEGVYHIDIDFSVDFPGSITYLAIPTITSASVSNKPTIFHFDYDINIGTKIVTLYSPKPVQEQVRIEYIAQTQST